MWWQINFSRNLLIFSCFICSSKVIFCLKKQPNIGILAQERSIILDGEFSKYTYYIPCSYVQAIESAGAVVVPIVPKRFKKNKEQRKARKHYYRLVDSVNGIVFPGEGAVVSHRSPYYEAVQLIYKRAVQLNVEFGKYYPVLGISDGFHYMLQVVNDDKEIVRECDLPRRSMSINFTGSLNESVFYNKLTPEEMCILEQKEATYNNHWLCVFEDEFKNSSKISSDWKITTITSVNKNLEFVSSIEHVKYPFFGIEFLPQRAAFEFHLLDPDILHSREVIRVNRYFIDRFIDLARRNNLKFRSKEQEYKDTIYNYRCKSTIDYGDQFMGAYFFK